MKNLVWINDSIVKDTVHVNGDVVLGDSSLAGDFYGDFFEGLEVLYLVYQWK